jgi:hypothetical protein
MSTQLSDGETAAPQPGEKNAKLTKLAAHQSRWVPPGDGIFLRTYGLLRWAMPVLLGWLTWSIIGAWRESELRLPMTSISAYYYTAAQTVFIGVLIGLGALLVIIQGRTPWEDALMNTAGALAPFVALLPAPVEASEKCTADYCTSILLGSIPNNHDIIQFNVWSVVPVWVVLCAYLWNRSRTLSGGDRYERASSRFSAWALLVLGVVALSIWVTKTRRDLFYDWAHLASAGIMVGLLILSMAPFARWYGPSKKGFFKGRPPGLDHPFWALLWLTLILIVCWAVGLAIAPGWDHAVLVIEIIALAPFALYWVIQGILLGRIDRGAAARHKAA